MKFLIRIEKKRAYIYELEPDGTLERKFVEGGSFMRLADTKGFSQVWNWIKANTGCSEDNKVDIALVTPEAELWDHEIGKQKEDMAAMAALVQSPTAWTVAELGDGIRTMLGDRQDALPVYNENTKTFSLAGREDIFHIYGLYEGFTPISEEKKEENTPAQAGETAHPAGKKVVDTPVDHKPQEVTAAVVYTKPKKQTKVPTMAPISNKRKARQAEAPVFAPKVSRDASKPVQKDLPEATPEARQRTIHYLAQNFTYTVANKDD